jgi:hypothetical protein
MRMELGTGVDCRVIDFTRAKLEKKPKLSNKLAIERLKEIEKKAGSNGDPQKILIELKILVDDAFKWKKKLKRKK